MGEAQAVPQLADLLYGMTKTEIEMGSAGQEHFCRLVASGLTAEAAYRQAYSVTKDYQCWPEATRLSRAVHIVARIMQIRAEGLNGYVVQRQVLLEPLLWALNTARERGNTSEVRKCVMEIGKLFGLVVDKSEADVLHQFQVMKDVTINGDQLVFDVGSGQQVHVKGESIKGAQVVAADMNGEPVDLGEVSPLSVLQNAFKGRPMKPIDGIQSQDIVGGEDAPQPIVVTKPKGKMLNHRVRKARRRIDLMTNADNLQTRQEEELAAYGEEIV